MRGFVLAGFLTLNAGLACAADVVFLGEVHDNPAHHDRQAAEVARIAPSAIVWEMLTAEKAAVVTTGLVADEAALGAALDATKATAS